MEQHSTTLAAHIQTACYYGGGDTNRPWSARVAMTVPSRSPNTENGVISAKRKKKKTMKFQVNTKLITLCSNVITGRWMINSFINVDVRSERV